jgi:organic hydroperoxide reductase OsmC/OhrA
VLASPSPSIIPLPWSSPAGVDPEEAFVASIASCHMLTFLFVAARAGFEIASYEDEAVGVMTKNERGVPWVSAVSLRPRIVYGGDKRPSQADVDRLHHLAHEQCFIANSVKTEIVVGDPAGS